MTSSGAKYLILAFFENLGHVFKSLLTFPMMLNDYRVDVFLCKNERWVQKKWSHCLKIKSITSMTSSIKNLGKFGELYLIEQIQPGDRAEVCKEMPPYAKWGEESKKLSFEEWKAAESTAMAAFLRFFDRLIQPKFWNVVNWPQNVVSFDQSIFFSQVSWYLKIYFTWKNYDLNYNVIRG